MSLRRLTGRAAFAGDVTVPGLLHLALRRSPHARARVRSADASAALALPGVAAVLTPADAPRLFGSELTFVGDRVLAVAAEDAELARRALDAVRLDYEPLPAALDPEAAAADPARVAARLSAWSGDVAGELLRCDALVEREWRIPFAPAISLEPPVATTWLDEDRRLVVRTSAESPFRVRSVLAERLALPAARIRVVRPLVAGGSAGRTDVAVEDLCASVTLRTGRPARLVLSAGDELTCSPGRPAQRVRVRLGLREGEIAAIALDLLVDLGSDGSFASELLRSQARQALGLYRARAAAVEALAVRTNHPPATAPRGADIGAALALECAIDEAAGAVGADPAAFRRRHLRRAADPVSRLLLDLGEPAPGHDSTPLEALLAAGGFAGERLAASERVAPSEPTGSPLRAASAVAVARRSPPGTEAAGAAASLRLLDDGSFQLAASHASAGGTEEVACVDAAAAVLGVAPETIVCAAADTDSAAFDAAGPALTLPGAELAVGEAARQVHERILAAGAQLLGVPASDVRAAAGRVADAAGRSVSFAEIGALGLRSGQPVAATASAQAAAAGTAFAAARADVVYDTETGVVRVRKLEAVLCGGPFADPRAAEGAVEGALAGAVEQAFAGGLEFDAQGQPLVRSFRAWPLVAACDVPPLAVSFVPAAAPGNVSAISALADAAGRAALAALVNAVARASGTRPAALPLTPARLLG